MSDTSKQYRPPWTLTVVKSDVCVWHDRSGELVVIHKPEGFDFWNIHDSTGETGDGVSIAPFDSLDAAIDRVNKDIPELSLDD